MLLKICFVLTGMVDSSVMKDGWDCTLLIVEDDRDLQKQLRWHFSDYQVVTASDHDAAIAAVRQHEPEIVLQDLGLPPDAEGVSEGFRTLKQILHLRPHTKIIVMTGHHDLSNALRAISLGAHDFYHKPVNTDDLEPIVEQAARRYALEAGNRRHQRRQITSVAGLIAEDPAMLTLCHTLTKLAPSNVRCLLSGESGTGKEVFARAIHQISPRRDQPFIAINCAAIAENLMESELFGYEKGAFTGALKTTPGKVEAAHQGTLFLDELGDMPLSMQAKLLRVLQENRVVRVGGHEEIPVDVRVVSATNRDLEAMVAQGEFREDLFFRLSEIQLTIPPLRERPGDKRLLARYLFTKLAAGTATSASGFTPEALASIEQHNWPGNIRELENRIKRALVLCDGKYIDSADLGLGRACPAELPPPRPINLRQVRQDAEIKAIREALSATDNNMTTAAKYLGITRPTLYDLIKKHEISVTSISK